tara:strand:- start:5190 stop:5549 length:360 start_codon:yes stop_codon:yes gene_type:complete
MSESQKFLPEQFSLLEKYCPDWMVDSEQERYRFRVNRTMEELDDYYKAVFPLLDDIADYIDQYEITAMPPQAMALLRLGQMLMEVSPAVITYRHPDVPNSIDFNRFHVISASDVAEQVD